MGIENSQRSRSATLSSNESESVLRERHPVSADRYALLQEKVIAFLSAPESYGLEASVERMETPQFLFFMAGDFCYKLLRRNALGRNEPFSLDERHSLSAKEVLLGRNYAPELYLDLIPVRQRGTMLTMQVPTAEQQSRVADTISHGDESAIVDWVIVMRRYDFSKRYDHFAELYQPNFAECRELARLVTPGHTIDTPAKHVHAWLDLMDEMFDDLEPVVRKLGIKSKKNTLRACFNRAQDQLDRTRAAIQRRADRGLFGQIHGNLRLRNVVKLSDGLRMVNPKVNGSKSVMRDHIGDPFYDLATLIGELWSRGFTRQANWVFSHYCNRLFDSHALEGLQVLDLYIFLQALADAKNIKATLNARAATGQTMPSGLLQGGTEETVLQGHIKTARDSLLQDETRLIAIRGGSQTDRSNLARLLAPTSGRMPGALYLSAEQESLALYEVDRAEDLPQSSSRNSVWELVYRRMADKARHALAAGYSVILEGAFDTPMLRQQLSDLAEDAGIENSLIALNLFSCSKEDLRRREALSAFMPHPMKPVGNSVNTPAAIVSQTALPPLQEASLDHRDTVHWIELDASKPVSEQLSLVQQHINAAWTPAARGTLH
ncbi:AAA family ATPase [Cohaesibacter haloalkalitolerans]|uniref:AAA family ATPase n=1 Tax=Cohaesibacter haloalkalitolerans TaxID=1162980 RepID=UPI000E647385|nr:hypothetical protein [Cohaesibacter haloalkalitolerans]